MADGVQASIVRVETGTPPAIPEDQVPLEVAFVPQAGPPIVLLPEPLTLQLVLRLGTPVVFPASLTMLLLLQPVRVTPQAAPSPLTLSLELQPARVKRVLRPRPLALALVPQPVRVQVAAIVNRARCAASSSSTSPGCSCPEIATGR